jgi:transcriptional regulator with XRE-family HTH domain
MSGFKPPELSQFYRSLRARGLVTAQLAEMVGVTRPALTRVLNGARRPGPIFNRVAAHLTAEELRLLHVAHSSTWNTRRVAKRPRWTASILAK